MSTYSEILERPCVLNVSKRSLEILQLDVNLVSGLLGLCNLFKEKSFSRKHPTRFLARGHLQL